VCWRFKQFSIKVRLWSDRSAVARLVALPRWMVYSDRELFLRPLIVLFHVLVW